MLDAAAMAAAVAKLRVLAARYEGARHGALHEIADEVERAAGETPERPEPEVTDGKV